MGQVVEDVAPVAAVVQVQHRAGIHVVLQHVEAAVDEDPERVVERLRPVVVLVIEKTFAQLLLRLHRAGGTDDQAKERREIQADP
jgi:hypothetical protein